MFLQGWVARLGPQLSLFAVYLAAAELGLALDPVGGFATLVWAPTGLAIGSLVRSGPALWPAVSAAAFVANAWTGAPWLVALGIAAGNTLEAVLGARILLRSQVTVGPIVRVRGAVALLVAALASPVVSASVGVLSLWSGGVIDATSVPKTWQAWWLGDVLGALVIAPVVLNWSSALPAAGGRWRWRERALLAGAVFGSAALSFSGSPSMPLRRPHMIFPVLIWAALRFGPQTTSLSVLAASAVGIGFTVVGVGPYSGGVLHEDLLGLQGFMANAAVTSMFLAAAAAEAAQALAEVRAERHALENALGIRDEFLSIASHELRTPLAALTLQVTGLERALRERPQPSEHNRELERAGRAVSQVGRLKRVVDQLLDVSRISAGRVQLECQSVDLSQLVLRVAHDLGEQATRAGCTVNVTAPACLVGTWDPFRLEQVLVNLLTNAFKYAAGRPIEVSVSAEPERALLRVSDQGIGIAPEALERIFERFERVATGHQRKSLGIGLYIARRVVEAHSGSIRAESTPGVGSSFIVELPL